MVHPLPETAFSEEQQASALGFLVQASTSWNLVPNFVAEVVKTFEKLEESKQESKLVGVRYATQCHSSIAFTRFSRAKGETPILREIPAINR